MRNYEKIAFEVRNPSDRAAIITHLHNKLPDIWDEDYRRATGSRGEISEIVLGDKTLKDHFVTYLFDHARDRVVAAWGTSKPEPGSTRDKSRMRGFLGQDWSKSYAGYDRGHFFAHTMGGGTDINLFPQLSTVNRHGEWREMEQFCAENPGTFAFIRPIYTDNTWKPSRIEYGLFKLPPRFALKFRGAEFPN